MKTLIVEDDLTSRIILKEVLKGFGPCHFAVNGREAVEIVRAALDAGKSFDLVTLDIMMPEVDGQDALRQIRKLESEHGVDPALRARVVMTTALSDPVNFTNAFDSLCDAYLVKPLRKDKLLEVLRLHKLI